jgi:hypothetical protein
MFIGDRSGLIVAESRLEDEVSRTGPRAWVLGAGIVLLAALAAAPVGASDKEDGTYGIFNGKVFDMTAGWGDATACYVNDGPLAVCFRTEAEMDEWIAANDAAVGADRALPTTRSSCSGSLRLYEDSGYSGSVLYLTTRLTWLNLSSYGFDQRTSSYIVGPCTATFADLQDGGGTWYPSYLTEAYDFSEWMVAGWDNDVSSVRIY